jgi:hypothetical protein
LGISLVATLPTPDRLKIITAILKVLSLFPL